MKNRFHYILGLFLIGAMSSAQAAKPTQVVAEVNGQAITLEQFNQRYNWYVERFKFKMPKKLLEELSARFDKIAFTLTRKFEKQQSNGTKELFVVSQSINSISVDIP